MFSALLTTPDGTPWIIPNSTPLCLRETRILQSKDVDNRGIVNLDIPVSTRCLIFAAWTAWRNLALPNVYQFKTDNNKWGFSAYGGINKGDQLKIYIFTDDEQRPPIGEWGICVWGEHNKCILHHLSKALAIKGVMKTFPSNSSDYVYINYSETIAGKVAVMATVAGFGFYNLQIGGPHGGQSLPVDTVWTPQALQSGNNTIISYYSSDYSLGDVSLYSQFSGISGKNIYIDTARYD
ncbi:hypothetical protein OO184_14910 [Photorhabdus sp. APURE]|uniref:hypothetical protein n=1 Tax=Photorhabdus aballayi TaxID=2991723 RepID=UPI00223C9300|nr:hypothetical protein [Photorhabdus aballayi]MCW7549186.1 hypothetical protein [Photorhabdus aballayi]